MEPDNLYTIVKALTKTEKAYFKKFASRHVLGKQNKYVILFDEIASRSEGYHEKELKRKFHGEKFIKNYPVMKKYLTEMILKSLQSFYLDAGPDSKIKNEIRYIEILYKKGLFRNCAKILNRSLKHAFDTDNFLGILELLRWKKNLSNEGVFPGNTFSNYEGAHREEQETINKLKNLSDFRMLSYRAKRIAMQTDVQPDGESLRTELYSILNDIMLSSESQALSNSALNIYYHILALVYESLGKNFEALECRKRLINTLEKNQKLLRVNIGNYIITVYNTLGTCLGMKMYDELEFYISRLRLCEKIYAGKITENDMLLIFIGSSIYELRMHIEMGNFDRLSKNLTEIERGLEKFSNKIVKEDELHIFYLLGYSYFGIGNVNESLKWINRIINSADINVNSLLFVKSKILSLILHYELGNFELLDYMIKSTYRFLRQNPFNGKEEHITIEFLKKLKGVSTQKQLLNLFSESLHQFKTNTKNSLTVNPDPAAAFKIQNNFTNIIEFDLESWLECKIAGKGFDEIMRTKYRLL